MSYDNNHGMKISTIKNVICIEIYKNHSLYGPFINLKNVSASNSNISESRSSNSDRPEKSDNIYYAPKSRWAALMFIAQNCNRVILPDKKSQKIHSITPMELLIISATLPPFLTREISDYIRSLKYNIANYASSIFTGTQQSEIFGSVVAQYLELRNNINPGEYVNVKGTYDNILWNGIKFSAEPQCEKNT